MSDPKQTTSNDPKSQAGFPPANGSEKVIVYAGRHYGQVHLVISRTGNMLSVQFVDEVFEIHQCDTEPLSPNL